MDLALATTGLLMGLAGSPHCVVMCSAACGAAVRGCGGSRPQSAMAALQLGRVAGYAAAGAVAAASVSVLGEWGPRVALLRPLWAMVHVAALMLGLWLLLKGRQPTWFEAGSRVAPKAAHGGEAVVVGPAPRRQPPARWGRALALGVAWVAWPCGLLQSALLVAALASGPVGGAATMTMFALGSAAGLWAAPTLWLRLTGGSASVASVTTIVRLCGAILAAASGWALWHGVLGDAVAAFCR